MQIQATVAQNLDALAKEFKNSGLGSLLEVALSPKPGVYACADLKKDALRLIPLTTDMRFQAIVPKDAVPLPMKLKTPSGEEVTLALMKPKLQLAMEQSSDVARGVHEVKAVEGFIAHYWVVEKTDDAKEANLFTFTLKGIPILWNHKDIKTGEKLTMMAYGQKRVSAPVGAPCKKIRGPAPV